MLNYRTNELQLLRKGGVSAQSKPTEVYGKAPVSCNGVSWTCVHKASGVTCCLCGEAFGCLHWLLFSASAGTVLDCC